MNDKKPWYPDAKEAAANNLREYFKNKRESRKLAHECPVVTCKHGLVKDAKTLKLRDCTVCRGLGKIKPKP